MNATATTINRRLHTHILKDEASVRKAVTALNAIPGMIGADVDPDGKHFRVSYDAAKLQFPALLLALKSQGLMAEPGWWDRFKFSWYGYMDTNTRDNAAAESSPCCSNPEEITGPGRKKGHH